MIISAGSQTNAMNLKAFVLKIASWVKGEATVVEQDLETRLREIESAIPAWKLGADGTLTIAANKPEASMNTTATDTQVAAATAGNNVNTAVQIALALKAIDASLSVEAVQAATTAALAAAYPAAAA
jgi:hypothetical protein